MALEVEMIEVIDAEPQATKPGDRVTVIRAAALADFNAVNAGIAALVTEYGGKVYEVATTAGMDAAKAARVAIRTPRYKVEHIRKAQKALLSQLGKDVETEAARITAALLKIEGPIDTAIKDEEDRKATEKAKREQEERERQKLIDDAILDISGKAVEVAGKPSADIQAALAWLEATEITLEDFGDSAGRAIQAKAATTAKLHEMLASALASEEAQRQAEADRAELQRQRLQQEEEAAALRKQLADQQAELDSMRAAAAAVQAAKDQEAAEQAAAAQRLADAATQRAKAVQSRIDALSALPLFHVAEDSTSVTVAACIETVKAMDLSEAFFEGRTDEAADLHHAVLTELEALLEKVEGAETLRQEQEVHARNQREALALRMIAASQTQDAAPELLIALRTVAADSAYGQLSAETRRLVSRVLVKIPEVAA